MRVRQRLRVLCQAKAHSLVTDMIQGENGGLRLVMRPTPQHWLLPLPLSCAVPHCSDVVCCFVSPTLCRTASVLHVAGQVDAGPDVANGVDGKLSQARALLQTGQLCAAAEALMEAADGTQAAAAVQQWVADARARAAADQAVKLLQAHATATAGLTS